MKLAFTKDIVIEQGKLFLIIYDYWRIFKAGSHCLMQFEFEFTILLPQPSQWWDYKHADHFWLWIVSGRLEAVSMTQTVVCCGSCSPGFSLCSIDWYFGSLSRKPDLWAHGLTWQVIVSYMLNWLGSWTFLPRWFFLWLLRNDDNKRPNCSVSINSLLSMWAHDDKTSRSESLSDLSNARVETSCLWSTFQVGLGKAFPR